MVSPLQNSQQLIQGYNTNVIRIQGGKDAAINYPVQINYTAMLLDEDNKQFYLKTRDQNGILQPLREFKYEEITPPNRDNSSNNEYVTKEDFNKLLSEVKKLQKRSNYKKNYSNKSYTK